MSWRLASRLSVIVLALLVVLLVMFLQSPQGLSRILQSVDAGANVPVFQGTDLGGTPAPDFRLSDQFGKPISLSQMKGEPVILTFMYTHCTTICPLTAEKLHAVMQGLGPNAQHVGVVAISTDPKGDTTASALAFSKVHGMVDYWHFLTGTQRTLSPIWSSYSIYAQPQSGSITHSTGLYIIDKQGNERVFLDDDFTPAQVTADLKILLNE
jgi:protein SCO1/2